MSAKKILEFNPSGPGVLIKALQTYIGENAGAFEVSHHNAYSAELLKDADLALFSFAEAQKLLPQLPTLPPVVKSLQCFDAFSPEDGKWYPRLFLYEALRSVLVESARDLDNRAPAFVVGEGDELRVGASVCAHLGFTEVYLIGENSVTLAEDVRILSRGYFGVQFKVLPIEELTIQSVSGSLVINTVDMDQHEALLNDLSYFNFLKNTGYVLDCCLGNLQSPLLEEAEKAGLRVLRPAQVLQSLVELCLAKIRA
jgi:shikimate dehydrogenase